MVIGIEISLRERGRNREPTAQLIRIARGRGRTTVPPVLDPDYRSPCYLRLDGKFWQALASAM